MRTFILYPLLTAAMKLASHRFPLILLMGSIGLCGCNLIGPAAMAKMYFACIPEQTRVDTPCGAQPIEMLEPGDTVIGFSGKPVLILQKHSYMENPQTVFLRITFAGGSAVDLCGRHRLAGTRASDISIGQIVAGQKVIGIQSHRGETRSYDLLTEDAGYQIQGVPVNSMIEEMNASAPRLDANEKKSKFMGQVALRR